MSPYTFYGMNFECTVRKDRGHISIVGIYCYLCQMRKGRHHHFDISVHLHVIV